MEIRTAVEADIPRIVEIYKQLFALSARMQPERFRDTPQDETFLREVVAAGDQELFVADDAGEVEDITSICNALVLNIGTLNERTVQSMILAGKKANALCRPVILDPVGAGASALRTRTVQKLLEEVKVSVIRGNMSEMKGRGGHQGSGRRLKRRGDR